MGQKEIILGMLRAGEEVTPLTAFLKAKSFRLSERVRELISDGHDIISRRVNRGGKWVAKYELVTK